MNSSASRKNIGRHSFLIAQWDLARDLEALLTFLKCPEQHRTAVRTTNYIERLIPELRRRRKLPNGRVSGRALSARKMPVAT